MALAQTQTQTQIVRAFLEDQSARLLLVFGPTGSGKTSTCRAALAALGCECLALDPASVVDHKDMMLQVDNFLHMGKGRDMLEFMTSQSQSLVADGANAHQSSASVQAQVLFLDNFEILASQDRLASSHVLKLLKQAGARPRRLKVIVTCLSGEERRMTELKKQADAVVRLSATRALADGQDEYLDKNIYDVVGSLFERANEGLLELDAGVSVDPLLVSYLMYDNADAFVPSAGMQAVHERYASLASVEDHAFKAGDWGLLDLVSLVRCGTVRMQQREGQMQSQSQIQAHAKATDVSTDQLAFSQVSARSAQRHCTLRKKAAVQLEHGLSADNLSRLAAIAAMTSDPNTNTRRGRKPNPLSASHAASAPSDPVLDVVRTMSTNLTLPVRLAATGVARVPKQANKK